MIRKKLAIYGISFITFLLLLSLYVWSAIQSTNTVNQQRMEESIEILQNQIVNNLEYQAKDVLFSINQLNPEDISQLPEQYGNHYYIADEEGILHSETGNLAGRKIEKTTLKMADNKGYGILSFTDMTRSTQQMAMVFPLPQKPGYYFVWLMEIETFLEHISGNLPLSAGGFLLFNEWGSCQGYYKSGKEDMDQSVIQSLEYSIGVYNYTGREAAYYRIGWSQKYQVYLPLEQPQNWYIGYQADYTNGNFFTSVIPSSSVIIFALLFLIFTVVVMLDVINDKEKKWETAMAGTVDSLTGLVNAAGMQNLVEDYIQKNSPQGLSFICMDVLSFGRINSMFGYSMGDVLLKLIADVIKEYYRCGVRVNADCFTFLAPTSEHMLDQIEERLYKNIQEQIGEQYIQMISFRYGIYPLTDKELCFREIYDGSLLAMKEAKKQYKKSSVIYNDKLKNLNELQKSIEINMLHALSKEEFHVYVQPQFNLRGECCDRGETLIRWQSEFMGFLPPDKFIPVFENNGFIIETDFFMLTSALDFLQQRLDQGKKLITLAVNQSKVTISFPNYYERLKHLIKSYTVPLSYIELEITESTLENDWEIIVPLIHNMKKLGFHIAMDDFGSGFSSLNTLRILPIDILKIDKEFLKESDSSERSKKIIRSIINMARDLDIQVVCEGVETEEQLEFLRQVNCDVIQGYYYAKPLPIKEFVNQYDL